MAGDVENESKEIIQALIQQGWLDESKKKIELYSEYTHVLLLIKPLIRMFTNPQENVGEFPLLSKNKLRKILQRDAAKLRRTEGFHDIFSKVMDLPFLAEIFIRSSMHNTERRNRLIAEIMSQLQNIKTV